MDDDVERAYTNGSNVAWRQMLELCLRQLGVDDPVAQGARWVVERAAAIAMLREACSEFGDNDWPDDLHLADIIEKHLVGYLASTEPTDAEATR